MAECHRRPLGGGWWGRKNLILTGTIADINAFLGAGKLRYTNEPDLTIDVPLTITVSDNGNSGVGGPKLGSTTVTLVVTPYNDAPIVEAPATIVVTEDVATPITGIAFFDVDAGNHAVSVFLSAQTGVLTALGEGGVIVDGSGTNDLSLTGSIADINQFIAGGKISYTPPANHVSDVGLSVLIGDDGNTGAGGPEWASAEITLQVAAVNDAPTISAPATLTVTEDVLSPVTGIVVSDVDAGDADVTVVISANWGYLFADGDDKVTIDGSGTSALSLTGTISDINAYIASGAVSYLTRANRIDDDLMYVTIYDLGNTGSGSPQSATASIALKTTAVNDAPTINASPTIWVYEDTWASIGSGINFGDVDAENEPVEVTLSVASGTLSADSPGSVNVSGSGSNVLTLTGSVAAINNYLADGYVSFRTDPDSTADVTLTITIDDLGNSRDGGARTTSISVTIAVEAVNDAPVIAAPATINVIEDVMSSLTGISIADVDAGSSPVTVTFTVPCGTLGATNFGNVTVGGTPTELTLTGSIADINAYIAYGRLAYQTRSNDTDNVTLTVTVDDLGNTGSGGSQQDQKTVTLTVTAVNDPPTATNLNQSITAIEGGDPVALAPIVVTDPDAGQTVTVSLTLSNRAAGRLTDGKYGAATSFYDSGTGVWQVTGQVADVNAALAAVQLIPSEDFDQNFTIRVRVRDYTGVGPADGTITVTVAPVNDAPTISTSPTTTVYEDSWTSLQGISFNDIDAGNHPVEVTLSVPAGELFAFSEPAVTAIVNDGKSVTLIGTIADINTFVGDGLVSYRTEQDSTDDVTLTITISDLGNSGTGGAKTASATMTIVVYPWNDDPVISVPSDIWVTEDVPTALIGIGFFDVDSGDQPVTVTLTAYYGELLASGNDKVTVGHADYGVTLTGAIADINEFIANGNLSYLTAPNSTGSVNLQVVINDNGHTGPQGPRQTWTNVALQVIAVNDAPSATNLDQARTVIEDGGPELAKDLEEVDVDILEHTRNAARNDAQGKLAEIRAAVGALFSELRRYQTYGALQSAYGAMQATLGNDPLPEQVAAHDVATLARAVAKAADSMIRPQAAVAMADKKAQ